MRIRQRQSTENEPLTEYPLGDIDGYVMTHRGLVGVVVEKLPAAPLWRTALACLVGTLAGLLIGVALFALVAWSVLRVPLS